MRRPVGRGLYNDCSAETASVIENFDGYGDWYWLCVNRDACGSRSAVQLALGG